MTFVTPWLAALAAVITVPLLLLLYFLKLRRSPVRIPSTLLWRKSFEDLQVNTPFQRIRWSWLLLIQGLLLLALILAMAQPRAGTGDGGSNRLIVLIDRSASMNATDGGEEGITRLETAKDAARELVTRLGRGDGSRQMMIIDFGSAASVRTGFEMRRQVLLDTIDGIMPTDEQADLAAALELAGAFASQREDSEEQAPDIYLLSDGVVGHSPRAGGFALRAGEFNYVRIGPAPDDDDDPIENIGITTLSARRDLDDPAQVDVFARLINAGTSPREVIASLAVNHAAPLMLTRTIPGAADNQPGEAELRFTFELPTGGLIALRHNLQDDLPVDNVAALVLPPPARPRIAVVVPDAPDDRQRSEPDSYLMNLLEQLELDRLSVLSESGYNELDRAALDAGGLYDLVVFDRVRAGRLPGVPTISFGAAPQSIVVNDPQNDGGRRVLSWDRQHPVMRHVSLDRVVYSGFGGMQLPSSAAALAFGPDGPIIALLGSRGVRHAIVGYALTNSNWPLDVSLLIFTQNALDHLLLGRTGESGIAHRPGEPITVRAAAGVQQIQLTGPHINATLNVLPGEPTTLPAIRRAGVYDVTGAQPPNERIAVSVLSESESDIRPRDEVTVNAEQTAADMLEPAAPREWWPWLVGIALGLVLIEWMIYCLRVRSV